jgi:cytochrome bd-type quinol oxidase subunit 2
MSRRYAARIARLVAGVLLLVAAGRLLFVYSTEEFAEYSRHVKQPELYLSPWPDIARFSAIALASVPLVILCSIRLIRANGKSDRSPSSFSFAADCAGLYCLLSLLQYLIDPNLIDSTPTTSIGFLQNVKDALLLSASRERWAHTAA